jgi:glycosyltransferase involved in cell wall biosynthesis
MNAQPSTLFKMQSGPKISVITVCYNSAQTIRRTLESVVGQTYQNVEYIIVDGGSSDETLAIVDDYGHAISKIISEPDKGVYDAMNKGIGVSTGDWIHILNSDDYYAAPGVLQTAVKTLDPNRTNYFSMWREFADASRYLQDWNYSRWRLLVSAFLPHPALIVSRMQYDAVGIYDTSYRIAADHDMILRLTDKWPGLKHEMPLTVMLQGGLSEVNMGASLLEFRTVTERHGLPKFAGACLLALKRIWWRM